MAEILTLTTPLPPTSTFRIAACDLNVRGSMIRVVFAEWAGGAWEPNGREIISTWNGPDADALLIALNKANLSARSLHQRVLDRAVADGKLVGTVSGAVP